MVFSSNLFLFYFLPIVLIVNLLLPKRYRNLWLLIASLFFYAWGEPIYIFLMLATIIVNFIAGLYIKYHPENKKVALIISSIFCLGTLFFFKYMHFIASIFGINIAKLALPLGISFYTFQTLSYTIDVYRGRVEATSSLVDFALYVVSFPQLIAGPIVKYIDVHKELKDRKSDLETYADGFEIFLQGLFLKVLLANPMGDAFNLVEFSNTTSLLALFKLACYTFQIYFDFAGYSKMAIGLGKMLGFNFPENFNYPYTSKSVTEFWTRWHITLSSWFKEYVYIPLGGNRVKIGRHIFNLLVTWTLTGLWHGANFNFLIWGFYYFLILTIEKYILKSILNKLPNFIGFIYTIIVVAIGWLIFIAEDLSIIGDFFKSLFTSPFIDGRSLSILLQYLLLFIIAILFSTDIPKRIYNRLKSRYFLLIPLFILAVAMIVTGSFNPFLYFRF
ncbi:MAG: MBOAT family O-acyltransferase [Ezakiella sp.]|nr:MBOAT family O-acyltransferase [Ezakiella sp.]